MNTPLIKTIPTTRLELRELNPEVYDHIFKRYSDAELKLFLGLDTEEVLLKEKENLQKGLTMFNKSFLFFQLILKSTNTIIGHCGYHTWHIPHQRAELFYWIKNPENRQKGFMKEAMGPVLHFGFETMKLNRIEAFINPGNIPSQALLKNFCFREEGVLREHYWKDGSVQDSLAFSLLKRDYTNS